MEVNAFEENGVTTICLVGELDTAAVSEVKPRFDEFIAAPDKDYRIDCSKLSYIASAGLRLLLALRKANKATGRNVVLTGVNDVVMNVFRNTSFDKFFTIQ